MVIAIVVLSGLLLAYANGANDNFKGVATLFGSGTTDYRRALAWATITTFLGSLAAVRIAGKLLMSFSGKGLVDDSLIANPDYTAAVALGAALTVLLATRVGMPISTTHGLVGSLIGTGLAAGSTIDLSRLGAGFLLPLLVSPPLAIVASSMIYPVFRYARRKLGVSAETCLCVGTEVIETVPVSNYDYAAALRRADQLTLRIGDVVTCQNHYKGRLVGIDAATWLDCLHFLSAGAVSLARGLNDTPKIAALLLVATHLGGTGGILLVGTFMAIGGILNARRVANTMSCRITSMNHGQGVTANLITSLIVIGASRFGLPVSTTHVSCGALFGIGAVTGQARWRTIGQILAAWVMTLPLGAAFGVVSVWLMCVL